MPDIDNQVDVYAYDCTHDADSNSSAMPGKSLKQLLSNVCRHALTVYCRQNRLPDMHLLGLSVLM